MILKLDIEMWRKMATSMVFVAENGREPSRPSRSDLESSYLRACWEPEAAHPPRCALRAPPRPALFPFPIERGTAGI